MSLHEQMHTTATVPFHTDQTKEKHDTLIPFSSDLFPGHILQTGQKDSDGLTGNSLDMLMTAISQLQ